MPLEKGNRKASFEYLNVTKERTPPLFRHVLQFEKSEAQEGKALSHTRLPWVYTCESSDGKVARDHQMAPEMSHQKSRCGYTVQKRERLRMVMGGVEVMMLDDEAITAI